jgi:nucleoid-associated protein YgaU
MGLISLQNIDAKEELALARYREAKRVKQSTGGQAGDGAVTSSPPSPTSAPAPAPASAQGDQVSQAQPRVSQLPEPQSNGSQLTSVTYAVRRGDTLRGIADWFYGDRGRAKELYAANRSRVRDPEHLEPGTILLIPRRGGAKPLN